MTMHIDNFKKKFRGRFSFKNLQPVKDIAGIKSQLKTAIQFLKKQIVDSQGKKIHLNRLPWYLLIGAKESGKTTLLVNSKIKFILKKKIKNDSIALTDPVPHYDMWVTQNAVILDLPESYLTHKLDGLDAPTGWQHFLTCLKRLRGQHGLAGVVIALSLSEVMDKPNRDNMIHTLKNRIRELQEQFGKQLPFYFSITKCDLLPGFLEFFSDYGRDELGQAWGVPLFSRESGESLASVFVSRFNRLIQQLNKQLITRLYQEKNSGSQYFIKDFPLHLEKFKNEFYQILNLFNEEVCVNGVYLTSATQEHVTASPTSATQDISSNPLQNALTILQSPIYPVQTYFVKQFFLQGLVPVHQTSRSFGKQGKVVYLLAVSFILLGAFFSVYSQKFSLGANPAVKASISYNDNFSGTISK